MSKLNNAQLDFIHRWSRYIRHIDLTAVLKNNNFTNIAIYGGGAVGELFYEQLYDTDITVKCVIDQNAEIDFPYDVDVLSPEQFIESNIEVDAIFISPITTKNILSTLRHLTPVVNCPLIPIDWFIIDVDILQYLSDVEKKLEVHNSLLYLLDFTFPLIFIKNPSLHEAMMRIHMSLITNYDTTVENDIKVLHQFYNDLPECNDKYIKDVFHSPKRRTIEQNDFVYLADLQSEYFNVIDKVRFTSDNPKVYDTTIHFFGNCTANGLSVEDKHTIQSQLQKKLNEIPLHQKKYRVISHAIFPLFPLSHSSTYLKLIRDTEFEKNSILMLIDQYMDFGLKYYLNSKYISYSNVVSTFDRPHNMGEIFVDYYHMTHRGYKMLSEKAYSILALPFTNTKCEEKSTIIIKPLISKKSNAPIENPSNPSLESYISFLQNEKENCTGTIGSIVVNCNPFTLGHRYLIEQAKSQCDYLYIFVVEENKSFFSFEDRLKLVKAGTSDLPNVKVIRSGNFIISTVTLPEYFTKDTEPNVKIDASKDVSIFSKSIAPVLNISKRFVGEEPFDPITNQYNQALIDVLPKNNIDLIVIPRKPSQSDDIPISASRVRKLLEARDFEKISELVPKTTLDYLKERFGSV
ncbi:MAG: adenylyltransferase/cytidyltransferase family protein [Defluviitaleaceae bacterium]|nr:adenylyltransferase/cytidyltransferase family protein [Defluviitaleaceae bacterium]